MVETDSTALDVLTPERKRLLEALDTGEFDTITALCEAAKINRQTYYNAIQDQDFVQMLFKTTSGKIYAAIPKIMDKVVEQSKRGSFAHQKLLFEMVKIYQGAPETAVQVNNFVVTRGE